MSELANAVVSGVGDALSEAVEGLSNLASDGGFLEGLLGDGMSGADLMVEDSVLSGLLGDDDPFGIAVEDVSAAVGDVADDLFAGLAGIESLAGVLVDGGIIDQADMGAAVEYDPDVDGLLSDILGLGTNDILGVDSDFDALFSGDEGVGEAGSGGDILGDAAVEEALGLLFGDGEALISGMGLGAGEETEG